MFRARTSINVLLFLLWLLILAVIAVQWMNPPRLDSSTGQQKTNNDSADVEIAIKPVSSFSIAPLDEYQEIVERPLFYETRRPPSPEVPEVAVQEEPQEEQPLALTLIGVMVTSDAKVALVQNDDTNKVERLKLGDEIGGWEVQFIDSDNVVINKSDETKELALLRNKRKPSLKTTLRQELRQKRNQDRRRAGNQQQQDSEQQGDGETQEEQNADDQNADQTVAGDSPDSEGTAAQQNKVQRVRRAGKEGNAAESQTTQTQ
jgi:type II secretory pathway component PulC